MKISLERKLAAGFLIALVLAGAVGVIAFRAKQRLIEDNRWVIHTRQVLETLESVLGALEKAENTQRGYLLTKESGYLDLFAAAVNEEKNDLQKLKALVADNPQQTARITSFEALIQTKIEKLENGIKTLDEQGFAAAQAMVRASQGNGIMDKLRQAVLQMSDTENELLAIRTGKTEISDRNATLLFLLLAALTLILLALVFLVTKRELHARREAEAATSKARDAALQSAKLKAEFLATMSHEIRTPMNGIIGMSHLLLDTPLSREQRDFANTINQSADALLTIINDILDFSKIEAGKLDFEIMDFDLASTVGSAVDLLAPLAQDKEIELGIVMGKNVPRLLRGDAGRLRQVLTNLLSNAVKFTSKGEVVVTVETVPATDGTTLRFSVSDTGIGISREVLDTLFQPFTQADNSMTRRFGGTGLGLAIARQLVGRMGGQIGVESTPGKGSTFFFTAQFSPPSGALEKAVDLSGLASCHVLVVDDNEVNRKILHHQLAAWSLKHDLAGDGESALRLLHEKAGINDPYHIAILDMQMPGMDGIVLARKIREHPALADTRLLLLSSIGQRLARPELEAAGISTCLIKPVKPSQLFDSLNTVFSTSKLSSVAVETPSGPSEAVAAKKNLRILLAEDNPVNQKVALKQLQKLGYSADAVANGLEVLDALKRIPYGLVLMDCQMPEMDGLETTTRIRAQERQSGTRPLPIVALTANAMGGERERCLAVGMDDYISKPVRMPELARILARFESDQTPA
jgi:signal transduction histidine kinase/DNA-binding response OmpR family regulator